MSYNKLCCTSSLPGQWDVMTSLSTFRGVRYKRATWMPLPLVNAYPQLLGLILASGGSLSCSGLVLIGGDPPSLLGLISTSGGSLPIVFGPILAGGGLVLKIGDSANGSSC